MRGHVVALALLTILAAVSIAWFMPSGDVAENPIPEPDDDIFVFEMLPDGVHADEESMSLVCVDEISWHVRDKLHTHCEADGSVYRGHDVRSSELHLDPGIYEVTAMGETFDVTVRGAIERSAQWTYDADGTKHDLGLSFTIDVDGLAESMRFSENLNSRGYWRFSDLTSLVIVDGTVSSIAESLLSEYERIGGSADDRQGYADFLAAFVQESITYPKTVPGHAGMFDFYVYGVREYWSTPLETLCHMIGDCEDNSALLCAIYEASGFDSAMGGISGHVFAGVSLESFEDVSDDRLSDLDPYRRYETASRVMETAEGTMTFHAVETIHGQVPVGYLTGGDTWFDQKTNWGMSGFYPTSG